MLDSLLTVTKGALFWLALGWLAAVAIDRVVALMLGTPVSFIGLAIIAIPLYLLVAIPYTLIKAQIRRRHDAPPADGSASDK